MGNERGSSRCCSAAKTSYGLGTIYLRSELGAVVLTRYVMPSLLAT